MWALAKPPIILVADTICRLQITRQALGKLRPMRQEMANADLRIRVVIGRTVASQGKHKDRLAHAILGVHDRGGVTHTSFQSDKHGNRWSAMPAPFALPPPSFLPSIQGAADSRGAMPRGSLARGWAPQGRPTEAAWAFHEM